MTTEQNEKVDLTILLPQEIWDALRDLKETGFTQFASVSQTEKALRKAKERVAASWVKGNPLNYGAGYWHGFMNIDTNECLWVDEVTANDQ